MPALWATSPSRCLMLGRPKSRFVTLKQPCARPRAHIPLRMRLGLALHACGRFDEAVAQLSEARAMEPDHADTLTALGNALGASGALPEAIETSRKAGRDPAGQSWLPHQPRLHAAALRGMGRRLARTRISSRATPRRQRLGRPRVDRQPRCCYVMSRGSATSSSSAASRHWRRSERAPKSFSRPLLRYGTCYAACAV